MVTLKKNIIDIKFYINRSLSNLVGWQTSKKIVVFESDDWGSTRMPSNKSFDRLLNQGLDLASADAYRYNRYDGLATSADLERLFEVLIEYKDKNNFAAKFTPMAIMANPSFDEIEKSGFEEYFFIPFTEALKNTKGCERSLSLWKEGIERDIFVPQLHGREHLHVNIWLHYLKTGHKHTRLAFNEKFWGFLANGTELPRIDYQEAFQIYLPDDLEYQRKVLKDATDIFQSTFNYTATYFVPPNGPFNNSLNNDLNKYGIKFRSVAKKQIEPTIDFKYKTKYHYIGQYDKSGITYITRNAFFEPSQPGKDRVNACLNEIDIAFKMRKPAVISTHRVNYVGSKDPINRDNGLTQLSQLLKEITKRWPDVEFKTSAELGELISSSKKNNA